MSSSSSLKPSEVSPKALAELLTQWLDPVTKAPAGK